MKKIISMPLALVLCVMLTIVASANGETLTVVSDTSATTYATLRSYAPLGDPAWGDPRDAVITWIHPEWRHGYSENPPASGNPGRYTPEFEGADWISTAYRVDGMGTWRRFTKDIQLCPGAFNIVGTIWVDADDVGEIYANETLIGVARLHGLDFDYPFTVPPGVDTLTLDFIVANTGGSESVYHNPTGVIFKAVVTFDCLVQVDIKPGSDPNSINCNNEKEVITVAVLTTDDFDAAAVDHTTVTFEGASETHLDRNGEPRRHEEDVDGDGDIDLVFHFRLGDTGLTCDSTEGALTGETLDGYVINGTDAVRMIDRGGKP